MNIQESYEVKKAFINAFVLIGLVTFFYVLSSILYALDSFTKPLLWATIIGICLYPIKHLTTNFLRSWIKDLDRKDRLLSVGVSILPFQLAKLLSNNLSSMLSMYIKFTFYFFITFILIIFINENTFLLNILMTFYRVVTLKLPDFLFTIYALILFTLLFCGSLFLLLNEQSAYFSIISRIYWFYIAMFVFDFFGSLQVPFFFAFVVLLFTVEFIPQDLRQEKVNDEPTVKPEDITIENEEDLEREDYKIDSLKPEYTTDALVSNSFYFVIWCHIMVLALTKSWTLILAFILAGVVGITQIISKLSQNEFFLRNRVALEDYFKQIYHEKAEHYVRTIDYIIPYPIKNLPRLVNFVDKKIISFLDNWLDSIVSLLIIFFGIFLAILVSLFIFIQVQNESIYILTMATNVLNGTMQSGLSSFIPSSESFNPTIKVYIDNIYGYGETFIENKLDDLFEGSNPEETAKFKAQSLGLWRNIYFSFINSTLAENSTTSDNDFNPISKDFLNQLAPSNNRTISSVFSMVWDSLFNFKFVNATTIATFVQSNLGILATLIESIYVLIKNNVFLIMALFNGTISFLFGSSTIVFNFILSLVIFLSALFYILSLSRDRYLPLDYLLNIFAPGSNKLVMNNMDHDTIPKSTNVMIAFHISLERAISSVFMANFKLALFYGLYTSLTHQFFRLNLVIIPSVLAATFGAIPIVGSYWAAVPGVIELVFVRNNNWLGCILFILHIIPVQILDTAIYSQIKNGGHPYLTGLAIAGGVYWNGFEGAFLGPIILCCILVVINLYSVYLAPTRIKMNS